MRISVQPVYIPELVKAMQLSLEFTKREKRALSPEDLRTEFSRKADSKGIAKIRNIIGTLLHWGFLDHVSFLRYEPTQKCKLIIPLSHKRMIKEIKKVLVKKEPKFLEMLYLLEGSRSTIEDLASRLGTTFVSAKFLLKWGLYLGEIEKEGEFFRRRPTKGGTSWFHEQLARCVASEWARMGFNIAFDQGRPPVDLIAESRDRQRKIYVECKSSVGEIKKGIGQLTLIKDRKKNDALWLVLPTAAISNTKYNHLLRVLEGLKGSKIDLILYDLKKFQDGEATFRERIRLFGKAWKKDKDFLNRIVEGNFQQDFDEEVVSEGLQVKRREMKRILNRLVNRGLLLKKNEKYSLRCKKR